MGERFRQAIGTLQQQSKMNVSIDKAGTQCDGTVIVLLGVRLAADQSEHRGRIEIRTGGSWRALQHQFEPRQRFLEALERPESPAEILTALEESRRTRHR